MAKSIKKLIALVMAVAMVMGFSINAFAANDLGINVDKTAAWADEEKTIADVELSVSGGDASVGVDIIYILGRFLSKDEVSTNTMVGCLRDTIGEIVEKGTPVNFGIVPFSSTADPVMPLTTFATAEDMESFDETVYAAIKEAGNIYDGINMENAFITAKEMFADSELATRPDRQHLILVSSGHTYYFNSGDNNEYVSTVPTRFITSNGLDSKALFHYPEKQWMRARNNNTNSYPIPYHIVNEYNANTDKYASLWDCYWHYIDMWAKADVAAGDSVVYEAASRAEGNLLTWLPANSVEHSDQSNFKRSSNGYVIKGVPESELDQYVTIDFREEGTITALSGPNPLKVESAAHAIGNERAMWEAYNYLQENIIEADINFYPVYSPLRADGFTTNGNYSYYDYTDQYIGHSFMNMLAGGTAVTYSSNKVFFDPIKESILYAVSAGSSVEDYIGYDADPDNGYDFDFIDEADSIVLKNAKGTYTTAKLETATAGFDSTYTFTAPGASEPTFTLDYFKGNGTTEEKFIWTFGESISKFEVTSLSYQVALTDKKTEEGEYIVHTNQSAILYPVDGDPVVFPDPTLDYEVEPLTDLPEEDPPLADLPDGDDGEDDGDLVEIPEENPPLTDLPETGDNSSVGIALAALMGAAVIAGTCFMRKRAK